MVSASNVNVTLLVAIPLPYHSIWPGEPCLRNLPINRIPLAKNTVEGGQGHVLRLARGAEGERRARRLDPRRGVRPCRLETRDLYRHAPHSRRARTHRQLLRETL